ATDPLGCPRGHYLRYAGEPRRHLRGGAGLPPSTDERPPGRSAAAAVAAARVAGRRPRRGRPGHAPGAPAGGGPDRPDALADAAGRGGGGRVPVGDAAALAGLAGV